MLPSELIERKRDGHELTSEELEFLLSGFQDGEVADYQISAFLMAVYFQGLSAAELSALTGAMIDSGRRLDFAGGENPAVDKHSTGGVGDKVSLILAPLLAEFGLRVPMMSGRGLGHTGGTLDKLEAIPGFRTQIDLTEFEAILADVGCAMIGQTPEVAPLDGRLYALRDVTATVQSIPLIASSIISKKVAEGIEALVLDVKYGSGAFITISSSHHRIISTSSHHRIIASSRHDRIIAPFSPQALSWRAQTAAPAASPCQAPLHQLPNTHTHTHAHTHIHHHTHTSCHTHTNRPTYLRSRVALRTGS